MRMRAMKGLMGGMLVVMATAVSVAAEAAPDVAPLSASLLGRWRLDETDGPTAADSAGKHAGTCRGGVRWVEGRFGGAASFNGRDSSIALGDAGEHAEATISFWMRARNVGKGDYQGLVTRRSWGKGMLHLPIRKGRIDAFLHLGGSERGRVQSPPLTNDRWTHVAVTVSALNSRIALYVDGKLVAEDRTPGLGTFDMREMSAGYEGLQRYFEGELDEIVILSRALSPAAVAYLAGQEAQPTAQDRLPGFPAETADRLWRRRKGEPVKGSLVRVRGDAVILLAGEKEVPVALSDMTARDAQYARFLAGEALTLVHADCARTRDGRNIITGNRIPDEGYCDQPYVVVNPDGSWTCLLTTGAGHEGQGGQHFVATITRDQGKTWTPLIDIEPADGPEASYGVPLLVPGGRLYGFYTYNGDRINALPGSKKRIRADMLGWYCYRYSDDSGRTWSKRYRIPVRKTACDLANQWKGEVQIFWGIDKPKVSADGVRFAFTKLGRYMLDNGEGWMLHSDNILTETDPEKINWTLLPEGEHGIRLKTFGSVQEEHNHVEIGDKRLYMVYRPTTGFPCHTYSDDGGKTWDAPEPMTYSPGGQTIKNPRACPKLWRCTNGKFLFWFHHNGGRSFGIRNPAWISGGVLKDGRMHWSQPEVLLYDANPKVRMSYPDLIEQDGRYWVTETQKTVARVHEIPADLLEGMWRQHTGNPPVAKDAILSLSGNEMAAGKTVAVPELPDLGLGGGFSVEVWLKLNDLAAGQVILDSRDDTGRGIALSTGKEGNLVFRMSDGLRDAEWTSDPGTLTVGKLHHVVFIVDGGPCIISVVCDGVLCDGGDGSIFGWGRFAPSFGSPSSATPLRVIPALKDAVKHVTIYDRYLRTSEAVGNFLTGCPAVP